MTKVNVIDTTKETVNFENILQGDFFKYQHTIYVKCGDTSARHLGKEEFVCAITSKSQCIPIEEIEIRVIR